MIGIFLGIPLAQLEVIKKDNPADTTGCCTDLFIKWLEGTEDITWEKIIEAIEQAKSSLSIKSTTITTTTASK